MLAVVFPGQGSQRAAMGAPWRDHPSWAVVERLAGAMGIDVPGLLLDADAETLRQTRNAQPATFALSLLILDAARRAAGAGNDRTPAGAGEVLPGVTVVAVAGHSLGEYSAHAAAGSLDDTDAARLVAQRAGAMQAAADEAPGTMAAVLGLDLERVAKACEGVDGAWVANDNAPGQVVVAGTAAGVAAASGAARELGAARVVPLPVGGAFHSPLMRTAQARLDRALAAATFRAGVVPVVANVDATAHREGFAGLLSAQLAAPVRWRESLLAMADLGATAFLELGPGAELSGMVRRTVPGARRANVATPDDLGRLTELLGG